MYEIINVCRQSNSSIRRASEESPLLYGYTCKEIVCSDVGGCQYINLYTCIDLRFEQ